ncbi:hypothetical protein R3W88_017371 [Solanum pinnatisectum]|uniref:NB-ARC domain-containing protein n=1 Tax=Solanum pinnatisectum TaxID=50273 RepID=A0AAV9KZZ3_9SOLN|nr:hypothetical protein R3W88_017371 [Solanum pinnatisectum]
MVTTRIEEVAKHLQHHSDPYSLSFLTSEESWDLLEKKHLRSTESRLCIYIHDDLVKQLDHSDYRLDKISRKQILWSSLLIQNSIHGITNINPLHLLVKLRFVRALHLMDVELPNSWATAMQSLTQLRYLAHYVQHFDFKWISHLHHLRSLQLTSSERIHLRASTLWEMTKLRHVNIDGFSVVWDVNDQGSFDETSTIMLENMKTFRTCHIRLDNMNLSNFVSPPNLRHLHLAGFLLTEEMVLNIASMKKLESLKLEVGFPWRLSQSYCWDVRNVEFRALKYLTLLSWQIDEWKASEESFPVLEELSIQATEEIPSSFADIPILRLIELSKCINSLVVSAMNIKREIEENTGCDSLQVVIKSK